MNERLGVDWKSFFCIIFASSIGGSVGVVFLRHWVMSFIVFKAPLIPTTIATDAGVNTVHKLLDRE